MSPRLASALVLAGVFVLGGVAGSGVTRYFGARREHALHEGAPPMRRHRAFIRALDRDVGLDRAQRRQVRAILASHEPEVREIRRALAPLRRQAFEELRAVLRRDQQPGFQRFIDRQDARARAFDDGPSAPP